MTPQVCAWWTARAMVASSSPAASTGAARGQPPRERAPRDVLHREERVPVHLADIVDLHDVRVLEPRDRLDLHAEAGQLLRPDAQARDHLQRDRALELDLRRLVHDAHAPLVDQFQELVAQRQQFLGEVLVDSAIDAGIGDGRAALDPEHRLHRLERGDAAFEFFGQRGVIGAEFAHGRARVAVPEFLPAEEEFVDRVGGGHAWPRRNRVTRRAGRRCAPDATLVAPPATGAGPFARSRRVLPPRRPVSSRDRRAGRRPRDRRPAAPRLRVKLAPVRQRAGSCVRSDLSAGTRARVGVSGRLSWCAALPSGQVVPRESRSSRRICVVASA